MVKIILCKACGSPISLRSTTIEAAFTPKADKLRRKYRGKFKAATSESMDKQLCAECYEKVKQK